MYTHVYVVIYVYTCVCIYIYIYIYIKREREFPASSIWKLGARLWGVISERVPHRVDSPRRSDHDNQSSRY